MRPSSISRVLFAALAVLSAACGSSGGGSSSGAASSSSSGGSGSSGSTGPTCGGALGPCASCSSDAECGGALPQCDATVHTCFRCVPGAADGCPDFQYCTADHVCAQGCKSGASCVSGICTDHACENCLNDIDCRAGQVCISGVCADGCASASASCAGALSCCSQACLDTSSSIAACGDCSVQCGRAEFCDGTACFAVSFESVCEDPLLTVIADPGADDLATAQQLTAALEGQCPGATVRLVQQVDAGVLDVRGVPRVGGGELLIAPGGPYLQALAFRAESVGYSAVRFQGDSSSAGFALQDGGVLVSASNDTISASHDFFVIQLIREPQNGALSLSAYGIQSGGTRAAAWYLAHQIVPNRLATADSWMVVEWTDVDGDHAPSAGDTFAVRAEGLQQ